MFRKADTGTIVATLLYFAAAGFYFCPIVLPHKIALGLFILTLFSFSRSNIGNTTGENAHNTPNGGTNSSEGTKPGGGNPTLIALAFLFSFLGDLSGSFKAQSASILPFVGQMGAFTIGHIFFILHFLKMRQSTNRWAVRGAASLALTTLASALIVVVPNVNGTALAAGVGLYALIISTMLFSAFLNGNKAIRLGAVLFVLSDYTLAVNMFVTDIPYSRYCIMIPYFAAQLLFFLSTRNQKQ